VRAAIARRQDFWTGVIYIAVGLCAFVMARHYTLGSAARMGPGYFPTVVALLLVLVGAAIVVRAFLRDGALIGRIAWKPMLLVLGSIVAFAFLINRAGLIAAAAILVLGCAAASDRFRLGAIPLLGLAALIAFCVGLFVIGMGIPMPLVGPWLGGP
jgi:uncharacterized membrane protein YhaH (DUF805 family)